MGWMVRSVSSTPGSSATTTTDHTASLRLGVTGQTVTAITAWSTPGRTSIQTISEDSSCEMDAGERQWTNLEVSYFHTRFRSSSSSGGGRRNSRRNAIFVTNSVSNVL